MEDKGHILTEIHESIGVIKFFHPKSNSLPKETLKGLALEVTKLSRDESVKVIVLRSQGDGAFCAGASFDELMAISNFDQGKDFFMGFARLILAMKNSPKFIITRVQGKAVGGGVGIIAASDYSLALNSASIKLSELELGIGPFVVGPAVERKIGPGAFNALSIDTSWRDAAWAENHGLYSDLFDTREELDKAVLQLAAKLSKGSPEAMKELKQVFWEGTENWEELLEKRAEKSGRLVLSKFTSDYIAAFKAKG